MKIKTAEVFTPLLVPSRYKAIWGGRGSGKSQFFADAVVAFCISNPGARIVAIREVQKSLRESAKRLIEDKIDYYGLGARFRKLRDRIITPGDGVILFQGMQDHTAETIKSLEGFQIAWVEEAHTLSQRSLELLRPTIRAAKSELWFCWNPRFPSDPVDAFFRGGKPPSEAIVVRALHSDNPWFPQELERERMDDLRNNSTRYGHIWEGDYEPAVEGAIWTRAIIQANRRQSAPIMTRTVVAVDPAVTSGEGADETGIIVCGHGKDGRGYVLDDVSVQGAPDVWAKRAVAAFDHWNADVIVAEKNQGGDMVRSTLHAVRKSLPVRLVHASRRKAERAQPIAALDGLGRISHVGEFQRLEEQMLQMTAEGFEGAGSPDRVDARVHGFTHLFSRLIETKKTTGPQQQKARLGAYRTEF